MAGSALNATRFRAARAAGDSLDLAEILDIGH